jgi:hypothetical protein
MARRCRRVGGWVASENEGQLMPPLWGEAPIRSPRLKQRDHGGRPEMTIAAHKPTLLERRTTAQAAPRCGRPLVDATLASPQGLCHCFGAPSEASYDHVFSGAAT